MIQTLIIKILQNLLPTFLPPFREFFITLADLFPALRKILLWAEIYPQGKDSSRKKRDSRNSMSNFNAGNPKQPARALSKVASL